MGSKKPLYKVGNQYGGDDSYALGSDGVYRKELSSAYRCADIRVGMIRSDARGAAARRLKYVEQVFGRADCAICYVEGPRPGKGWSALPSVLADQLGSAHVDAIVLPSLEKSEAVNTQGSSLLQTNGKSDSALVLDINGLLCAIAYGSSADEDSFEKTIGNVRGRGAEYIVALAAGDLDRIAECGADCVIGVDSNELSEVRLHACPDGREAYIVPSVGCLVDGVDSSRADQSIVLKIDLYRSGEGIVPRLSYIPCRRAKMYKFARNVVLPVVPFYAKGIKDAQREASAAAIADSLGSLVKPAGFFYRANRADLFYPQFSINELCELLGASPDFWTGRLSEDEKLSKFIIRECDKMKGMVAFRFSGRETHGMTAQEAAKAGALFYVDNKDHEELPTMVIEGDPFEAYQKVCRAVLDTYNPYTIAITGSIGKTTTTDMTNCILANQFDVFDSYGNYNTVQAAGLCMQKLRPEYEYYVQEAHGGSKGYAALMSEFLTPDLAAVTYIGESHLNQLGSSIESVRDQKLGIIKGLKPGGAVVLNVDNEHLRDLDLPCRVVTYAAYDNAADYHAENIRNHGEYIDFDIVCEKGVFDARIYMVGEHNVSNALCAFALSVESGADPYLMSTALSKFRAYGIRQHLFAKDGYKVFVDCFNASPNSIKAAVDSFTRIPLVDEGRYIAVLGDIRGLGKKLTKKRHREVGKFVAESKLDIVLTFGEDAQIICDTAKKLGMEAYGFTQREDLEAKMIQLMRPGDALMFKSAGAVRLEDTVRSVFQVEIKK